MFTLTKNEIENIDTKLNPKIQWAEQNNVLAEQLAMDATRLLTCTVERLDEYKDKGFFNRCLSSFSGKTAEMQRQNQNDLIKMQKMGWRYLQLLNERDILMAHSLITIKNNLETLIVDNVETKDEITRLAIKVKEKFDNLSNRVENLEVTVSLLHWLSTIEVHEYNEKYPYYFRLLSLVQDFQIRKKEHWNFKDIQCLQQAILKAEINRKEKITIHEFIKKLIDEIEDCSFGLYNNMIQAFIYEANVDLKWLDENISSSVFNCLYMIADKYNDSKSFAEANQNHLKEGISQKEVVTNGIIQSIKNAGVDTEKELQLQDLALEILSCSKLAYTLAEKPINDNNKDEEYKKPNAKLELSSQNNDKVSPIVLENLQLSLMSKAFSASDDFCILIDNNHQVKTFGRNGYGCLGIGSNENKIYEEPVNVIDVPQDIACISVDSGKNHAIALFENGDLYAWGKSDDGQLGDNTKDERLSGFKCMGLPKNRTIVKILASAESSIVLFENGEIYATGKLTNSLVFQPYELNFRVKDFDVMYDSSDIALVLVDSDNKILIKKIGYSSETKWIEHSEDDFYQPLGLHEDAIISKLSAGNCYLHVVTQNNTLYAIGDNSSGQLGTNERSTWATKSFKKVYGINEEIRQIVSGGYCDNSFALVLTESKIYGWGDNESWQLGKQENYRSEYTTSGLIRKETHERKYYLERKPKVIKEFLEVISKNSLVELSCSAERSFICDKKNSKIYKLGYTSDNVEIISY